MCVLDEWMHVWVSVCTWVCLSMCVCVCWCVWNCFLIVGTKSYLKNKKTKRIWSCSVTFLVFTRFSVCVCQGTILDVLYRSPAPLNKHLFTRLSWLSHCQRLSSLHFPWCFDVCPWIDLKWHTHTSTHTRWEVEVERVSNVKKEGG